MWKIPAGVAGLHVHGEAYWVCAVDNPECASAARPFCTTVNCCCGRPCVAERDETNTKRIPDQWFSVCALKKCHFKQLQWQA
jgi:hypothetical protein